MSASKKIETKDEKTCTGICKIKRNSESINCFICETSFHFKCSGLSNEEFKALKQNEQSGCVYLCSLCKVSSKNNDPTTDDTFNPKTEINELKEQLIQFNLDISDRLTKIEKHVIINPKNHLQNEFKNIENKLSEKVETLGKQITTKVDDSGISVQNKIISYAERVNPNSSPNQSKVITEINKKFDVLKNDLDECKRLCKSRLTFWMTFNDAWKFL